jgi:hypothetical protein
MLTGRRGATWPFGLRGLVPPRWRRRHRGSGGCLNGGSTAPDIKLPLPDPAGARCTAFPKATSGVSRIAYWSLEGGVASPGGRGVGSGGTAIVSGDDTTVGSGGVSGTSGTVVGC